MTARRCRTLAIALAAALGLGAAAAPANLDFELYDLADRLVSTRALRAAPETRLLAIDFFALDCAPCRKALPEWIRLHETMGGKGLRVLVVAEPVGDDREAARAALEEFFRDHPVPFPVAFDKYGVAARQYGVAQGGKARLPQAFLIERSGRLLLRAETAEAVIAEARRRL